MRLNEVQFKNASSFYVVKTVYLDRKQTTKVVENINNSKLKAIIKLTNSR